MSEAVHPCQWPGCLLSVPMAYEMCRRHWERLPSKLRGWVMSSRAGRTTDAARQDGNYRKACIVARQWAKSHPDPELPPFQPGDKVKLVGTMFAETEATVTAVKLVNQPTGTRTWTIETTAGNYPPNMLRKSA